MKSLHSLAPTQSPYDFQTVSMLYTQFSTYLCWNQQFLIMFNPHSHKSLSMICVNQNSKSPKYCTQILTTVIAPANYCILSVGQGMRALTKKLPGYLLLISDMLLNLLLHISTLHVQPSLALFQVFDSGTLHKFPLKVQVQSQSLYKSSPLHTHGDPLEEPILLPKELVPFCQVALQYQHTKSNVMKTPCPPALFPTPI